MKSKNNTKTNLVTLSLEELQSISGGASTTLDEQQQKTAAKAPEELRKTTRGEAKVKTA